MLQDWPVVMKYKNMTGKRSIIAGIRETLIILRRESENSVGDK